MTPNGVLPMGYQKTDLPIIFSHINDGLPDVMHAIIRMVNTPMFRVSANAHDMFDVMSEYFESQITLHRVLIKNLTNEQIKNDHNLFVIGSIHDQPFVEYLPKINLNDIFTKLSFSLFKKHNSIKLVFVDNKEGAYHYSDEFFGNVRNFVEEHALNSNKIIFITNTSNIKETYENYLKNNNLSSFMICESINFYVGGEPGKNILRYETTTDNYKIDNIVEHDVEYSLDATPVTHQRNKYFLCLNRNSARLHRPKLILKLIQNGIFDKGLTSLLKSKEFDKFCEVPENRDYKTYIKEYYPFIADYDDADNVANMHNFFTKKDMWNDTYFSIVSESSVDKGPVFITEKVVRPIIYFHPFIVYGNPNTLTELRKLGFETFPEFFDETYDLIQDEDERLLAITQNIKRICSLSLEELHQLYHSVYHKLIHNRNVLTKLATDNFVGNKFLEIINL